MSRKLDDWIKAYMQYTSLYESSDDFHFWTAISTIAGALRRQVWIDCVGWDWIANFYIIFVAPPGIVAKSTTANLGMELLKEVPKVRFGASAVTWQAFVQELSKAANKFQVGDKIYTQSALTFSLSELGTFLDPSNREMIDMLVDLWDGRRGEWKKVTKGSGSDTIVNPWVNFIGCTTPAWIANAFPEYMIGGGFTSRAVFVYSDQKRKYVAYPQRRKVKIDHLKLKQALIDDLKEIAKMAGEYVMTEEAMDFGEEWYENFHKNRPKHLDNDQFEGYFARKQTHIHKLAIVLSAAKSSELVITKETLAAALDIITMTEHDMPKVFSKIGQNLQTKHITMISRIVRTHHAISDSELYKLVYKHMSTEEFAKALESLKKANMITVKKIKKGYEIALLGEPQGTSST